MKSVYLLSDDLLLVGRWVKLINHETYILENLEELINISNSLLIINSSMCKDISSKDIEEFLNNQNEILLLDNTPNFLNAKKFLGLGIKGYGNTLMTSSYLNSAIEALSNSFIWLLPLITTQLMKDLVDVDNQNDKEKEELLFESLTAKEIKVAKLLKDGYTNSKISTELEISINTVKTHIKHIYEKLSVKDRLSFATLFSK